MPETQLKTIDSLPDFLKTGYKAKADQHRAEFMKQLNEETDPLKWVAMMKDMANLLREFDIHFMVTALETAATIIGDGHE